MNILIVEDDKFHSELLGIILKKLGQNIHFSKNGKEAYEKASKINFDLIFMDLTMPDVDGFDAAKLIRKDEKQNNKSPSRIVAITASSLEYVEEKCLESGMDECIQKPISTKIILAVINNVEQNINNPKAKLSL